MRSVDHLPAAPPAVSTGRTGTVVDPDRRVGFGDGKGLAANQIRLNPRPVDDARDGEREHSAQCGRTCGGLKPTRATRQLQNTLD